MKNESLITVRSVTKTFSESAGPTLEGVDLTIQEGEFVALLGPSGCGKSTLLRIINGLLPASSGQVTYRGELVQGAHPKAAMVFQTSALYPWLTVQQNVELGLKTQGVGPKERAERSAELLRLIGLDGYEDAFPRELSGGMRQRVAFARALAVEPELLCMDEPFAALDPLTAENLRDELIDLWREQRIPLKCILMVTHGIEEAVYMADRILILRRNPGRVAVEIPVRLPHPRDRRSEAFSQMVDLVYKAITTSAIPDHGAAPKVAAAVADRFERLPNAAVNALAGLLELVDDHGGRDDLYTLGGDLLLEVDDLLPITEAAELLGFAAVTEGDLVLGAAGKRFVEADPEDRKALFYEGIRALPLFATAVQQLQARPNHTLHQQAFAELLEEQFGPEEGLEQLQLLINWGRYAELFHYDAGAQQLYLDEGDRGLLPQ